MWYFFKKLRISLMFLGLSCALGHAAPSTLISLDLQNVKLTDALHLLAHALQRDIILSPSIQGTVTLHLQEVSAEQAFALLLHAENLNQYRIAQVWMIVTRAEFMQKQQEEIKLQVLQEDSAVLVTRVWQIHYAKAEEIAAALQDNTHSMLSKRGHVYVDKRTNIVCVQDIEVHMLEINNLIKRLDVPVQQVLIEARLASVDSDYQRILGMRFSVQAKQTQEINTENNVLKQAEYSLAVIDLADGSRLDVQLAALENSGHGELISSPSLFTANQQPASIEAGEEIPYQEVSDSGGTAIAFKKAVLALKVTPQIMPGNQVLLQLQVNQDRPNNRIVLGVPAITTRQINTHILVKNGQTVVLGGIYEVNKENDQQEIPFLGKIPILGWLFRQQTKTENKRELLIFVTPKIIMQNER